MSFFRCLPGADALSSFRQQRLLADLAKQGVMLDSMLGQYLHFVWSKTALDEEQTKVLEALLAYGDPYKTKEKSPKNVGQAIAIPRFGTVSPWASKATEIARQCGLQIFRIERGIRFTWRSAKALSAKEQDFILSAIHDRMTEAVIVELDQAEGLYQSLADTP